jgi:hypothetical protein
MTRNNEVYRPGCKLRKKEKEDWSEGSVRDRLFLFYLFALCAFFVYFVFFVLKSAIADDKSITSQPILFPGMTT